MKVYLVLASVAVLLLLFLLLAPAAGSSSITEVSSEGSCHDFSITVSGEELGEGCWDVKIDVPGNVYNPYEKRWKSSFFYVERSICSPDTSGTYSVKLHTSEPFVQATAKLRQNSRVLEKGFTIVQECPASPPEYWILLAAVFVIIVFCWGLTYWWKGKQPS